MSLPFLVIQLRPEDETSDSEFAAICKYGELDKNETVRIRAEQAGLPEIRLNDYSGIIVGGSPFDVSKPVEEKSEIQIRVETDFYNLFDEIAEIDFPFLGCCSGNGLLGSYCGATISTRFGEDVGGADIQLTEAGKQDPLLESFPESFRVLLGHKEACDDIPPGTTLLASNDACPVQMFRLKQNIYATQFHPEGDFEGFSVRVHAYKNHGYFPPEEAEQLIDTLRGEDAPWGRRILQRFVARYRR